MTRKQFLELMKELGCCLLGICCPPGGAAQRKAFLSLAASHGVPAEEAGALFDAAVAEGAKP
jgi:hypothetical protein